MKHVAMMCACFLLPACSSSSGGASGGGAENDASRDTGGNNEDSSAQDSSAQDSSSQESSTNDAPPGDAANDTAQGSDASDGGCSGAWVIAPSVPASVQVPADGGGVLLHVSGAGTQNYACTAAADGGVAWVFVGPQADLSDCNGNVVGHHYASDGGPGYPEWITVDGTYVVAQKLAAYTPDGGSGSVPWLLLHAVDHGGTGTLSQVAYVQRLDTDGGVAPAPSCDAGDMAQVPYTADYWFYGP